MYMGKPVFTPTTGSKNPKRLPIDTLKNPPNTKYSMKIITINVPKLYLKFMEELIEENTGLFPSRSELIRVAIRDFLQNECYHKRYIEQLIHEREEKGYETHTLTTGEVVRVPK